MVGKGVPVQEEILTGDSGKSSIESGPILAFRLAERTGANGEAAPTEKYQDYSLPEDQQRLVGTEAERGIAIADFDCRVETDYMRQLVAIQADLEKKFVKSHLTQLNQLMTAIDRNIGR
jgi:hypothetical protein